MLRNLCWNVCNDPCGYLKHGITKDAFIALQTSERGAHVLWLVCLCITLSVSPPGYLQNNTFAHCHFCACYIVLLQQGWRNSKRKGQFFWVFFPIVSALYSIAFRLNRSRCRLGWWVGLARGTIVLCGGDNPRRGRGNFWGKHVPNKRNTSNNCELHWSMQQHTTGADA